MMPGSVAARLTGALSPLLPEGPPVRVRAWDGSESGPDTGPVLVFNSPAALRHVMWSPNELGFARAYVTGEVAVDGDLTDCLRRVRGALDARPRSASAVATALARGVATLIALDGVGGRPPVPDAEAHFSGRRHTRRRDAQVVAHHYDVSNTLYRLLLGDSMAYSCAFWASDDPHYTLADAQRDKLDLVCRKLELRPGSRLLDVGCGWGALAIHAARHYGAEVIGLTVSRAQLEYATESARECGVSSQVRLMELDYRDIAALAGAPFDAVAAVEMGEHVGAENYSSFLRLVARRLSDTGRLLIQQMSRSGKPGGGAFVETYIAPDMSMRPLSCTARLLEDSGFELLHIESLRTHYVRTIRAWLDRLEASYDAVVAVVGAERARVWRLYLTGGALAFEEGRMGVDHFLACKGPTPGTMARDSARPSGHHVAHHRSTSRVNPVRPDATAPLAPDRQ